MMRVFFVIGRVANTPHPAMGERRFSITIALYHRDQADPRRPFRDRQPSPVEDRAVISGATL